MKLPATTQRIIAELKEAFTYPRFDEELVREGFEEHLELLKLPKRAIVFHPNPVRAILRIYELAGDATWAATWAAAGDAVRDAAWDAARDAAWDAAWDAAGAAAWDAAGDAARDAAGAAAWAAAWAASRDAARDAAWDAARAAAGAAAWAASWAAARDAAGAAAWDAAGDAARAAAGAAAWDAARAAAWDAAGDAARDAAGAAAWAAAGAAAWAAAWAASRDAARDAAGAAAWDAAGDAARAAAGAAAWAAARAANPWLPFLKIVKGGCLFFWMTRDAVHVAQAQIFSMEHPSGQRRLHYEQGPAIEYRDGSGLWFWKGTQVTEQIILRPETFKAEEILAEQNAEVRRIQIERFGMERFLREANAKVIHSHEMGQLYSLDLPNDPDRKLKAVLVKDPSTNRSYFLRVPPSIKRADDAVAWSFHFEGLEAKNYRPIIET